MTFKCKTCGFTVNVILKEGANELDAWMAANRVHDIKSKNCPNLPETEPIDKE